MLKVLIYSPLSLRFGGGFERWVLEVASRLRRFDVCSTIVCTRSTVGDEARFSDEEIQRTLEKASIEYVELPYVPFTMFSSNSPIPKVTKLETHMRDCDIVYFPNAYAFQDILMYILKFLQGKPVVSGQHATIFSDSLAHNIYMNTIGRSLLKRFDAYHVLNSQDLQLFEKWGLSKVYAIPIGIDPQRFKAKTRKEHHTRFKVLFVGRLTLQKGVDILLKSIEIINQSGLQKSIEFSIVGSGPMKSLVQKTAKLHDNVKYLGIINDLALPDIYADCDLLVMPSRRETFGIVALEAQASGLPVVASNISGPSDVVLNGATGTLIQKESSKALASAVIAYYNSWLQDPGKYEKICIEARNNALKRYDWDTITGRVYDMLVNVAKQGAVLN